MSHQRPASFYLKRKGTPMVPAPSILPSLLSAVKLLGNFDVILLLPFIISYGFKLKKFFFPSFFISCSLAFIYGTFPAIINDTHWSSRSLTVFGVTYICGREKKKYQ
jgi:hypothetical protein